MDRRLKEARRRTFMYRLMLVFGFVCFLLWVIRAVIGRLQPEPTISQAPLDQLLMGLYSVDTAVLPKAVSLALGVYSAKYDPTLSNTVLVTAANFAYLDILRNWQCAAKRLGLKYVIIAMDQKIFEVLGPDIAVLTSGAQVSGEQHFRDTGFNAVSCGKIASVQKLLDAGIDVIFSDPDNLLLKDPLRPGAEIGAMIRSGKVDYAYEANIEENSYFWRLRWISAYQAKQRLRECEQRPEEEGNTGFYFARASSLPLKAVFSSTLERCNADPSIDDQTHFWSALNDQAVQRKHCTKREVGGPWILGLDTTLEVTPRSVETDQNTISYCCLDPRKYVSGRNVQSSTDIEVYHANFGAGKAPKIQKLRDHVNGGGWWGEGDIVEGQQNINCPW